MVIESGGWSMTVTTVSGIPYADGTPVIVLANGSVIQNLTVQSGAITLPPASKVHVGLSYTCDFEPVNPDFPTQRGSLQDKIRRAPQVTLKLLKTRSCWIGPDPDRLVEVKFRNNESANEPTNLYSGTTDPITILPPRDKLQGSLFVRVTDPLPCTIQAIISRIAAGEN
jgi:hypothetical protein